MSTNEPGICAYFTKVQEILTVKRVEKIVRGELIHERNAVCKQVREQIKTPKGVLLDKKGVKAVRARVYRNSLLGLRVFVSNQAKNAMWPTGRRTQPELPLAFWYEQGFGPRVRKGRGIRHVTGATSYKAVPGIHALDRAQDYLAGADDRVFQRIQDRLNKEFDKA